MHSLVSLVMKGVGNPQLIVPGAASPHGFSLKPSQAMLMEKADIIFWIGPDLETFLEKPLQVISNKATKIKLIETPKLEKLKFRVGGKFEEHDHDHGKHKDEKHDDHGKHKDEKHDDHGKHKDEKHDDHGHVGSNFDPHIWLDPTNAKLMLEYISHELEEIDPANAPTYEKNFKEAKRKIDEVSF